MDKIININKDEELNLSINEDLNIIININASRVNINYDIKDARVNILYLVDNEENLEFIDRGNFIRSDVKIAFFDLTSNNLKQNSELNTFDNSKLFYMTKYLVSSNKDVDIICNNDDMNTDINIDNSCVVLDEGHINLKCTGKIIKGAKNSTNHQKSRALVYGSPDKARIDPILLIEESDVEASHALTFGTIDDDVLYYLNSRGITKKDALQLLINSYLLKDEGFIDIFENKEDIKERLSKRVLSDVK